MNLTGIKTALANHAPSIFTGIAAVGVVETAILAAKATPVAEEKIKQKAEHRIPPLTTREKVIIAAPCYIPALASGILTIGCLVAANSAHIRKEAGAAAACAYYEARHNRYKDKNKKLFGEENDKKIEQELAKDDVLKSPPPSYLRRYAEEEAKFLCYEPITDQYFMANKTQLIWAELTANKILQQQKHVTLNQILKLFPGASCTRSIGNTLGWYLDDSYYEWMSYNSGYWGTPWMDIEPELTVYDEREIFVINFSIKPMAENMWDIDEVMDSQDVHRL